MAVLRASFVAPASIEAIARARVSDYYDQPTYPNGIVNIPDDHARLLLNQAQPEAQSELHRRHDEERLHIQWNAGFTIRRPVGLSNYSACM
jgi:hypothetical protein